MKLHPSWYVLVLAFLLLTACLDATPAASFSDAASPADDNLKAVSAPEPDSPVPRAAEATLLAVGDIMVHMPQLPAYYDPSAKRYDFSPWFAKVAPILETGDWVVGNLETPLAGAELKYTGFPRFNAPTELAEALHESGMHLVSTANNHAMDRGFAGVQRTLDNVRKAGLIPVGTSASANEAQLQVIVERAGIRMGFLSYTYGTNGLPVPQDKPYAVNLIEPERMAVDIRRLREAGADAVTVSLHFGVEYQKLPNDEQIRIARSAVGSGADIVLGSHPHVVQPYDIVEVPASDTATGENRRGVVIYSLGNFISNQTGNGKDIGLIFGVRMVKSEQADGTSVTTWDRITLTPTWVHIDRQNNKRHYTVLPIQQTLKERNDPTLTDSEYDRLSRMLEEINRRLHTFVPEK